MRDLVWVFIAWFGTILWTAIAVRWSPAWIFPDTSIIVISFLAFRRDPIPLALIAIIIGYLVGRQTTAPFGLHETAMVVVGTGLFLMSGRLADGGRVFFTLTSSIAVMVYHLVLFLLLYFIRTTAGFASWATALLIPTAIATGIFAFVLYNPMCWLDSILTTEKREGLEWR